MDSSFQFQSQSKSKKNIILDLLILSLISGLIGLLVVVFVKSLSWLETQHTILNQNENRPYHLILIPIVLFITDWIKKNSLYFPTRIAQLEASDSNSKYWGRWMFPLHFIGTLLSHASGVSVGREGAVVLFSSSLVRVFKINWHYWGPILSAVGFSAITGNYWVSLFFMSETFGRTNFTQKIFVFLGAMIAVAITHVFQIQHLFAGIEVKDEMGFLSKLVVFFIFAILSGYICRFYKEIYFNLSEYFKKLNIGYKLGFAVFLMILLFLPEFRKFQSLGLNQFSYLINIQSSYVDVLCKLAFTVFSTSLGFLGGEFIPLVYSGTIWGFSFFHQFSLNPHLGALLGAFLLFAGTTRLKWTSYVLVVSLLGFGWWFWSFYVISLCVGFSGPRSIYQRH